MSTFIYSKCFLNSMVVKIFLESEVKFLRGLGLRAADNSTMIGSFRDSFPGNSVPDVQLIAKYRFICRSLGKTAKRSFCIVCGKQVYLLEGETKCPGCR